MARKNVKLQNPGNKRQPGALFIPAGLFIGMGFGLYQNNLPMWLFVGMGVGFLLFALTAMMHKSR